MSLVSLVRKASTTKGVLAILLKAGTIAGAAAFILAIIFAKVAPGAHIKTATAIWAALGKGMHSLLAAAHKDPLTTIFFVIVFIVLVEIIQEDVDLTIR